MMRLEPFIFAGLALVVGCSAPARDPADLPGFGFDAAGTFDVAADTGDAAFDAGGASLPGLLERVDPLIGTGGDGFQYAGMTPAVQVPLGLVKLGPDTTNRGSHPDYAHHFSGYWSEDPHIRGFSHLHFVGTGTTDYGNFRVGAWDRVREGAPSQWWADKGAEEARPGYYRVELEGEVVAELTASRNAGRHRYTLPAGGLLTFDAASTVDDEGVTEAWIEVEGTTLTGGVVYDGSYVGRQNALPVWFHAELSAPPDAVWVWSDGGEDLEATTARGEVAAALLRFDAAQTVELVVGVSTIDAATAAENAAVGSFDEVRRANEDAWLELLGRVDFGDLPEDEAIISTTALYNCFRMPTRLDEDGRYRGLDGELHDVDHPYYTDLSLWDTYRTLHPLWTLVYPELQRDVLRSLLLMARDGGYVPRWPAGISYTSGMEGDPAAMLFAEGALGGIDGVDYEQAFDALMKTADAELRDDAPYAGRTGIEDFVALGFVPADRFGTAASNTFEYSIADNALANLAAHLGRTEENRYRERAANWRNGWDPATRFFRPRNADGTWVEPFPFKMYNERSGYFAEGTAWHYRFGAMHDPEGMIELFGGAAPFASAIEEFMEESRLWGGHPARLTLPDPYYWHGNEPPLHVPFYLAFADEWDRMIHWVGEVRTHAYSTGADGLAGNDDGGTLSAWWVLSSLGLYPVVGTDRWITFEPFAPGVSVDGIRLPATRGFTKTADLRVP